MKKTILKTVFGALCISAGIVFSMLFAYGIFEAMLVRDRGAIKIMIEQFSTLNVDAAFICAMILVLWTVDLIVRPLIKDLIETGMKLWRDEEDGTTTTATAKDA